MDLSQFDYPLPQHLIAQNPPPERDQSRLLIVNRKTEKLQETFFHNIVDEIAAGDALVLNNTHVFPARLLGYKDPGGAKIEALLLSPQDESHWEVIAYRASRLKPGSRVRFSDTFFCQIIEELGDGKFIAQFHWQGKWDEVLSSQGQIPLPPYITREEGISTEIDKERYQTVFARQNRTLDSAAAPTAGLHFTPEILQVLQTKGVKICYVTLRIGLDTFLPMRCDKIEEHKMHSEFYHVPTDTASCLKEVHNNQSRIIAVGTTSMRVLESAALAHGTIKAGDASTDLFIYPGYQFKTVDAMITNFHLPKTSLLLLVSAFMGNTLREKAYQYAVEKSFRFFSYGDAMFIQ